MLELGDVFPLQHEVLEVFLDDDLLLHVLRLGPFRRLHLVRDGRYVNLQDVAWTAADSGGHLNHVGTKAPNFWGLFDLMGNAAEWCSDPDDATFAAAPFPEDVVEVVRGGCAWDQASELRLTAVGHHLARADNPRVGFRVVVEEHP